MTTPNDYPSRYSPTEFHAVVIDEEGQVLNDEDVAVWAAVFAGALHDVKDSQQPDTVMVVTGTAIPCSQSMNVDDFHWASDAFESLDVAAEYQLRGNSSIELLTRFTQAKAMAAGLNAHLAAAVE